MTRNNGNRRETVPDEIRRQFGSPGTARFLHALPAFQVEPGMPDRFQNLLAELDRAEPGRRAAGQGRER